ncbi:MAG TPA: AbrB family transcriptional regulator [Phycisphaerae bacterium]|nr:AbrB family transcriptional regulator [Phycisphaerae bacterium]
MSQEIYKDVTITSKGQLTLPVSVRAALKLGRKRKVRVAVTEDGVVTMRPLPDVMSFFGKLKGDMAYDPDEKEKAREAMGRRAARKG